MLAPQALRLSFHDCVGGCDGCVNKGQASNIGLGRIYDILKKDWEKERGIIGKTNNPTLRVIHSVMMFCKFFLTCSIGRWADTAATVQTNW